MKIVEKVYIKSADELSLVLGTFDENINAVARETGAEVFVDSDGIKISGEESGAALCKKVIEKLAKMVENGEKIDAGRVTYLVELAKEDRLDDAEKVLGGVIAVTSRGKQIKYKTYGQKK